MIRKKILIPSVIAAIAVIAVATSPSVLAIPGGGHHYKHQMDIPDLEFSEGSIPVGERYFGNLDKVIPVTSAVSSLGDDKVLMIGLQPVQDHIVYAAKVVSDDTLFFAIIDAGTGDVLYRSEGKSIQEIEDEIAAKKAQWEEMRGKFSSGDFSGFEGMKGHFGKFHKNDGDFEKSFFPLDRIQNFRTT